MFLSEADTQKLSCVCDGNWAIWFFSLSLIGLYTLKYNTQRRLSEQELIDCTNGYGNFACNGGYPSKGLAYIQNYGIVDEYNYPYRASVIFS